MAQYTRKLQDHSPEELKTMPRYMLCALRADAFVAHVESMPSEPRLTDWAARMERRFGPQVKIWEHTLPWVTALMVGRYGEDLSHWPAAFSEDDVRRAQRWEDPKYNDWPLGSQPIL